MTPDAIDYIIRAALALIPAFVFVAGYIVTEKRQSTAKFLEHDRAFEVKDRVVAELRHELGMLRNDLTHDRESMTRHKQAMHLQLDSVESDWRQASGHVDERLGKIETAQAVANSKQDDLKNDVGEIKSKVDQILGMKMAESGEARRDRNA